MLLVLRVVLVGLLLLDVDVGQGLESVDGVVVLELVLLTQMLLLLVVLHGQSLARGRLAQGSDLRRAGSGRQGLLPRVEGPGTHQLLEEGLLAIVNTVIDNTCGSHGRFAMSNR